MLWRIGHFNEHITAINSLRAKFNDALNDSTAKIQEHILTVASCNQYEHFDHKGGLLEFGRAVFFQEIDDLMRRFGLDKIKLLPNKKNKPAMQRHPQATFKNSPNDQCGHNTPDHNFESFSYRRPCTYDYFHY